MGAKVIVALNMIDEAEERKIRFDIKALSEKLGSQWCRQWHLKRRDRSTDSSSHFLNGRGRRLQGIYILW